MKKIAFVCLGNICRSPMAEFVMKQALPGVEAVSRATSRYEIGNPIYPGTQKIFQRYAIPYDARKTAQQIAPEDFETYDFIVGMDAHNVADLKEMAPEGLGHKVYPFAAEPVPDPWYTGDFEETYARVSAGCQEWKKRLQEEETYE